MAGGWDTMANFAAAAGEIMKLGLVVLLLALVAFAKEKEIVKFPATFDTKFENVAFPSVCVETDWVALETKLAPFRLALTVNPWIGFVNWS